MSGNPENPGRNESRKVEREQIPQLPNLGRLALLLGFEDYHEDLKEIESRIIDDELDDEEQIKKLITLYHEKAYAIMVEQNKRSANDSLALILQLAHFRYTKGMFSAVLDDFKGVNEAFQSPEVDDDTYELVGETMAAIRAAMAEKDFS
ncbi:MAG: hypothetical protein ACR2KZ_11765 [Segetibacter sp.]